MGAVVVSCRVLRLVVMACLVTLAIPASSAFAGFLPDPMFAAEWRGPSETSRFGTAVAIYGDTAVVGVPDADPGGLASAGAVYVYERTTAGWTLSATLTGPGAAAGDKFGSSVAIYGDQIAVGAPYHTVLTSSHAGAVYVFDRSGTSWVAGPEIWNALGAGADDHFGWSVALSGVRLAVGAPDQSVGAVHDQGAAYVFTWNGSAWTNPVQLTAPDGVADDLLGRSVSLDGNVLAVGAPFADPAGISSSGAVYVFRYTTVWSYEAQLTASDGAAGDHLGETVSYVNGPTGGVLAAGARYHNHFAPADAGAAYVFRHGGAWSAGAEINRGPAAVASSGFGSGVALSPTGAYLIVGAVQDTGPVAYSGAAYAYRDSAGVWVAHGGQITAPDATASDGFGWAVAVGDDPISPGYPLYVIGAPYDDHGSGADVGGTYAFGIKPVWRFGGADRYEVAATVADGAYPGLRKVGGGVITDVIVAAGSDAKMADPLTAAGLAGAYDAPLLLVQCDTRVIVPAPTIAALNAIRARNGKVNIHVVGGPASVTTGHWAVLKAYDRDGVIDRIGGLDRYEVAYNVYARMKSVLGSHLGTSVLLACGNQPARFFDALAASPAAARSHLPILLVKTSYVPPKTLAGVRGFAADKRYIVGPPTAVTEGARAVLGVPIANRIHDPVDPGRSATAARFAAKARAMGWTPLGSVGLANKVADSLTGGAALGSLGGGGVLLFTEAETLNTTTQTWLAGTDLTTATRGYVFGGPASVWEDTKNLFWVGIQHGGP